MRTRRLNGFGIIHHVMNEAFIFRETYFFIVTAINNEDNESNYSIEISIICL